MIVADVNVMVYLLIDAPLSAQARRLASREPQWCVPELWQHEFINAVATIVRRGQLSTANGEQVITEALRLFAPVEFQVDLLAAYRMAMKHRISTYDAQYVALAEALGVRCVSADQQLLERVPRWTRSLDLAASTS